ncbi:uncharacterized protein RSE6_07770 [Rhynchosporium secalis]|uniref:Xylanolytic transcriptional activator regulatory domain-containing protein n=1 Tax=Rhynchosporium secalis TaxID=38038 RepID=A0A1E1MDP5_RHYSE|nr:uncharacterized protein RSE6_07770 [Rhynchosporium secalis]
MSQLQSPSQPSLQHQANKRHQACTCCRQVKVSQYLLFLILHHLGLPTKIRNSFDAIMRKPSQQLAQGVGRTICSVRLIRVFDVSALRMDDSRLNEVTQELSTLQKKLAERSASEVGQSSNDPISDSTPQDGKVPSDDDFYFVSSLKDMPHPAPYMGDIELKTIQIAALFEHFHEQYNRHCPILNTNMSIATLFSHSPFLFWTIVMISSRHHPTLAFLCDALTETYRNLLEKTLMAPLNTLAPIQAGILLCVWPLNPEKQVYDPSWNYCGLVTNAAIRMGLHRSGGYRRENISPSEFRAQSKTWLACCFVNYSLVSSDYSSHMWQTGVCLLPEVPNMLTTIPSPHSKMEKEFLTKNSVLRVYAKTTAVLGNLHENIDVTFLQYLCKDLDNVREANKDIWNPEADIILLGAQLCIYTQHLERSSRRDQRKFTSAETDSSTDILANIVFGIASRLITTFTSPSSLILPHVPKHYFQMLLLASTLILKLSVAYPGIIGKMEVLVQNLIAQSFRILDSWCVREGDEYYRAARLIQALAQAQKKHQLKMKEARNALGSGITVLRDAIVTHRALRGEDEDEGPLERPSTQVRDFGVIENLNEQVVRNLDAGVEDGMHYGDAMAGLDPTAWEPRLQDAFSDWNLPWGWDPAWSQDFGIDIDENMYL